MLFYLRFFNQVALLLLPLLLRQLSNTLLYNLTHTPLLANPLLQLDPPLLRFPPVKRLIMSFLLLHRLGSLLLLLFQSRLRYHLMALLSFKPGL